MHNEGYIQKASNLVGSTLFLFDGIYIDREISLRKVNFSYLNVLGMRGYFKKLVTCANSILSSRSKKKSFMILQHKAE